MTSIAAPETTLYDLASTAEPSPGALQINPATFKSMVSSLFDLMIEQGVPAWVWIKLPRGDSWQSEIERVVAQADHLKGISVFRSIAEDSGDADGDGPPSFVNSVLPNQFQKSSVHSIQLPFENPLKGEFLVLVWSEQMTALLAAKRSRSSRSISEAVTPTSELGVHSADESSERKTPLLATCLLEAEAVKRAVFRMAELVQQPNYEMLGDDVPLPELAQEWQQAAALTSSLTPALESASVLLGKHIQRQEELWQRSMTYRKQAELVNVLQLQNEELTSTVRSKDEFLSMVGQQLRTPLTNMKTALTLLNSPNIKPPQRQRYMDLLTKECDRQGSLIGSLLDLVSLDQMAERKTLEPIKLVDVVPGVVSTYQPLSEEKGVRLAYTIPEGLPAVANLTPWLRQIVVNLLHNGIKFTPRGGQVWVRAKQQGDYLQLEFKDTGVGIPVHEIPKIFDRFYRVRQVSGEDEGGAGLGLTIVQQLLLRCGGSISVKSRPGEGSIFNVLLPVYKDSLDSAADNMIS
ncbi:histidine kinase [filamentous cyanobacterium LEGE 11480]|uniref:histidine kinase n=1 Tax=Romeriopsis navalis LEGE 11480 TaxID=2777977 RepID=A0A928VI94_9CYAN|nr:ATP-binding protein [Romeriopsis navalis]MBE9028182.1 histidine kinase [Romeriopsis navalis LEGE 11480]